MTLLGFNLGTAPPPPSTEVDMSLDDVIASRQRKPSSTAKTTSIPKKVSNVDRSVATARAKRSAAMAARRGLSTTPKATRMEIENEVKKQAGKTAIEKAQQLQKSSTSKPPGTSRGGNSGTGGGPAAKAERRRRNRTAQRDAKQAAITSGKPKKATKAIASAAVVSLPRPPPRRAIEAAVNAMEGTGYHVPEGMQMVISFTPAVATAPTKKFTPRSSQNTNRGGGSGGRDGIDRRRGPRGGRGGRGG